MLREALLVRTLVELADNLADDFDVVDVLTVLSDRCVEALDVASAGVMLLTPGGELRVVASSSATMRTLELFEVDGGEGPCVDSLRQSRPIVNVELLAAANRWPRFVPRAVAAGFCSVSCLPMRLRGQTVGVLSMFSRGPGALEEADVQAAQALADVATIAVLQHRVLSDARTLNDQLNQALNTRIVIEQAKGKLSEAANLDMDGAFQRLRGHARSHNLRLAELCRAVVDGSLPATSLDPAAGRRRSWPAPGQLGTGRI